MILELGEGGCIALRGPYIASDIVPGTGSHISSDMRPGGEYVTRDMGPGGPKTMGGGGGGGPFLYYTGTVACSSSSVNLQFAKLERRIYGPCPRHENAQ